MKAEDNNNNTGWHKNWHIFHQITSSNIDQFSNFFTFRIVKQFAILLSLKIPQYLKRVATLPFEISVSSQQQLKTTTPVTTHFKKCVV